MNCFFNLKKFFILFVVLLLLSGCQQHNKLYEKYNVSHKEKIYSYKHFTKILVKEIIYPESCEFNNMTPDNKEDKCSKYIGNLPPIIIEKYGSGGFINTKNGVNVLTAGHVCQKDFDDKTIEDLDIKIKTKSMLFINIVTFSGIYVKSSILKLSEVSDLCLLKLEDKEFIPESIIDLSIFPPEIGGVVHSVTSPQGIALKNSAPIFFGIYSGISYGMQLFTLYSDSGSSGSLILNENNRLVGMITKTRKDMHSISLSPTFDEIHEFLR